MAPTKDHFYRGLMKTIKGLNENDLPEEGKRILEEACQSEKYQAIIQDLCPNLRPEEHGESEEVNEALKEAQDILFRPTRLGRPRDSPPPPAPGMLVRTAHQQMNAWPSWLAPTSKKSPFASAYAACEGSLRIMDRSVDARTGGSASSDALEKRRPHSLSIEDHELQILIETLSAFTTRRTVAKVRDFVKGIANPEATAHFETLLSSIEQGFEHIQDFVANSPAADFHKQITPSTNMAQTISQESKGRHLNPQSYSSPTSAQKRKRAESELQAGGGPKTPSGTPSAPKISRRKRMTGAKNDDDGSQQSALQSDMTDASQEDSQVHLPRGNSSSTRPRGTISRATRGSTPGSSSAAPRGRGSAGTSKRATGGLRELASAAAFRPQSRPSGRGSAAPAATHAKPKIAKISKSKQAKIVPNTNPDSVLPSEMDTMIVECKVINDEEWLNIGRIVRIFHDVAGLINVAACQNYYANTRNKFRAWKDVKIYRPLIRTHRMRLSDVDEPTVPSYDTNFKIADQFVKWSNMTADTHPREVLGDDWDDWFNDDGSFLDDGTFYYPQK